MAQYAVDWATPIVSGLAKGFSLGTSLAQYKEEKTQRGIAAEQKKKDSLYNRYVSLTSKGMKSPKLEEMVKNWGYPEIYQPKNKTIDKITAEERASEWNQSFGNVLNQSQLSGIVNNLQNTDKKTFDDRMFTVINKVMAQKNKDKTAARLLANYDKKSQKQLKADKTREEYLKVENSDLKSFEQFSDKDTPEERLELFKALLNKRVPQYNKFDTDTAKTSDKVNSFIQNLQQNTYNLPQDEEGYSAGVKKIIEQELSGLLAFDKDVVLQYAMNLFDYNKPKAPGIMGRTRQKVGQLFGATGKMAQTAGRQIGGSISNNAFAGQKKRNLELVAE